MNGAGGPQAGWAVFDRLYGAKQYTAGAELQLPRKVPMRVEPKSYFGELWGEQDAWVGQASWYIASVGHGFHSVSARVSLKHSRNGTVTPGALLNRLRLPCCCWCSE